MTKGNRALTRLVPQVHDFSSVIDKDPQNANAYFNRGSAYDSIGDYNKAIAGA